MGKPIKVSEQDREHLEAEISLLCHLTTSLVQAPESQKEIVLSHIEGRHKNLGEHLTLLVPGSVAHEIRYLHKPGTRGKNLVRYLLMYFLWTDEETKIVKPELDIKEDLNDGMGGLGAIIDADDRPSNLHGEVYKRLILKAQQLRKEGRYQEILTAMKYVREKYKTR